jgi:hypothetical protein
VPGGAGATRNPWWLLAGLLCGYGFAWIGHFGFEKNKPASFKRPLYSFMGDWVMYRDMWVQAFRKRPKALTGLQAWANAGPGAGTRADLSAFRQAAPASMAASCVG